MRKPYTFMIITMILLLSVAAVQAQSDGEEQPVDYSLAEAILGVLTPEQTERFLAGADPATLRLEDASTLADFIAIRAIDTAGQGVYHPVENCYVVRTNLSALGRFAAGEIRDFQLRGTATDLSDQGGDPAGCGVAEEATAAVLNLQVRNSNAPGLAQVSAVGSNLVSPVAHFDRGERVHNMVTVPLGSSGDWRMRLSVAAHVSVHVVGYFSPLAVATGDLAFDPATQDELTDHAGLGDAHHPPAGGIPPGFIGMWSGNIADIPAGWALCDGANGTPNLLDRFVKGVSSAGTDPGATGGSATHDHGVGSFTVPAHDHGGATGAALGSNIRFDDNSGGTDWDEPARRAHTHGVGSESGATVTGTSDSASSEPEFFAIAFIMKL